ERVHPRTAVLSEYPTPRGRTFAAPRARGPRGRHADVRDRLPPLRELVPQVRGRCPRLELDPGDRSTQAALGQRRPLLPPLRSPRACLVTSDRAGQRKARRGTPLPFRSSLNTGCASDAGAPGGTPIVSRAGTRRSDRPLAPQAPTGR